MGTWMPTFLKVKEKKKIEKKRKRREKKTNKYSPCFPVKSSKIKREIYP